MKDFTDVIIAPIITEKASSIAGSGVNYVFKVAKSANKTQIKEAFEQAFGVTVLNVNTLNTKAKDKRVGKYAGKTKTYKKAIITVKDGDKVEI